MAANVGGPVQGESRWLEPHVKETSAIVGWGLEKASDALSGRVQDFLDAAKDWIVTRREYAPIADKIAKVAIAVILAYVSLWTFGLGALAGVVCGVCSPGHTKNIAKQISELWKHAIPPHVKALIVLAATIFPTPAYFAAGLALGSIEIAKRFTPEQLKNVTDRVLSPASSKDGQGVAAPSKDDSVEVVDLSEEQAF